MSNNENEMEMEGFGMAADINNDDVVVIAAEEEDDFIMEERPVSSINHVRKYIH